MGFTKFLTSLGIISALNDKPNVQDGLSASALKAKFDEAGQAIQDYINETLISELEGEGAAGKIGIAEIDGLTLENETVQDALQALANTAISGLIPDGAVQTSKIYDEAVTTDKLADGSVTTDKLADEAVTGDKLADECVALRHIPDGLITTDKLAPGAVLYGNTSGLQREMSKYGYTIQQTSWDTANKCFYVENTAISPNDFVTVRVRHDNSHINYPSKAQIGKWGIYVSGVVEGVIGAIIIMSCKEVPTMDVPVEFVVFKAPAA
jgi:hypothetical protein